MNSSQRYCVQNRLSKTTRLSLLYFLIYAYADSAAAAAYTCTYYSMPGYTPVKTIPINATDTSDALQQAKASFQGETFYNANFNWIFCKL